MNAPRRSRRAARGGFSRRRIPRRRLHFLRIDIAAAVFAFAAVPGVAWLAMGPRATVRRQDSGAFGVASAGGARSFAVGMVSVGARGESAAEGDPFSPWAPGAGDGAMLPELAPAPPPDAAAPPVWPLPSGGAQERAAKTGVANRYTATLASFAATGAAAPPSPGPFASPDPLPPLPPPAKPSGEALLFRDVGWVLPIVVINSPESGRTGISALERAILSEIRQPATEAMIERVPLPLPHGNLTPERRRR